MNQRNTQRLIALALVFGANAAPAQTATPEVPTSLVGSDTLNFVMDTLVAGMLAAGSLSGVGVRRYKGLGSTSGERQMEGSPVVTEPTCLPTDDDTLPDVNPGCQEIAPMSRPLDSSICNDSEAAGDAEGLAVCKDGIVVITNNAAAQTPTATAIPHRCPTASHAAAVLRVETS